MITIGPQISLNGLWIYLDALNLRSYPRSGNTWTDLSGNGNTCTLTGSYATLESTDTGILFSNGGGKYARRASMSALNTTTVTIEVGVHLWALPTVSGYTGNCKFGIVELSDNYGLINTGFRLSCEYEQTDFRFTASLAGDVGLNIKNIVSPVWREGSHYCWTVVMSKWNVAAASEITHYINGVLVTDTAPTANGGINYAFNNTNNFTADTLNIMGRAGGVQCADGSLSFLRIYNRGLTATEIMANFTGMRGRFGL